jgi:hypothetical protein
MNDAVKVNANGSSSRLDSQLVQVGHRGGAMAKQTINGVKSLQPFLVVPRLVVPNSGVVISSVMPSR